MKQELKNKFSVIISESLNPYENLALEKFLLENVRPGQVFLYLWCNERTVVCGRNQNIWKECAVEVLLKDGGHPARRLSGGGAVYHDKENLNFTFIACEGEYSPWRQLDVIVRAVQSFGIDAQRSGRNDITACGAKFSGNAFYKANPNYFEDHIIRRCHHGTLMVDVDKEVLSVYLNPDAEKYTSKGVDSVKSRVCNLKDLNPLITVPSLADAMIKSFEETYCAHADIFSFCSADMHIQSEGGRTDMPEQAEEKNENRAETQQCNHMNTDLTGRAVYSDKMKRESVQTAIYGKISPLLTVMHNMCVLKLSNGELEHIAADASFFASDEWLFRNNIKFNVRFSRRFEFGDLDLRLFVEKGVICSSALYSDAMDEGRVLELAQKIKKLEGKKYSPDILRTAIGNDKISEELFGSSC